MAKNYVVYSDAIKVIQYFLTLEQPPSYTQIREATKLPDNTLVNCLKKMKDEKLIVKFLDENDKQRYRLNLPIMLLFLADKKYQASVPPDKILSDLLSLHGLYILENTIAEVRNYQIRYNFILQFIEHLINQLVTKPNNKNMIDEYSKKLTSLIRKYDPDYKRTEKSKPFTETKIPLRDKNGSVVGFMYSRAINWDYDPYAEEDEEFRKSNR